MTTFMNSETKDEIIFKCECHYQEYIELGRWSWNDDSKYQYELNWVARPNSFWDRLRFLFSVRKEHYVRGILLSKGDVEKLRDTLNEVELGEPDEGEDKTRVY
jgi:hypothetical protein